MDFFDKLGKKASQTYKYTTEKTSKLAKEAKLRMSMNENKAQIEDIYTEIGKRVYQRHIASDKVDMDLESLLEEDCIQIDELCDYIEDERKEILILKDRKQCPSCFHEIEIDFHYCPNCGVAQEDILDKEEEDEGETIVDVDNEENDMTQSLESEEEL